MIIDPKIYTTDDKHLFNDVPKWLTSISNFSAEINSVVPDHDQSVSLIENSGIIRCLSNICSHKNAIMNEGSRKIEKSIVCPIHKWSWSHDGKIKTARGFDKKECMNLETYPMHTWNGHMFYGSNTWMNDIDLLPSDLSYKLNIENYKLHSKSNVYYNFDWKIFMEIFQDLYHVQSYHPGLRSLTDCKTFNWIFGKDWCCQTAKINKSWPTEPGHKKLYELYKELGYYDSETYGAIWLGIYPNIMIEYYPGSIVVSIVKPVSPGKCINYLEFYYEKSIPVDKANSLASIHNETFMKTADEDEIIGNKMQKGLELLSKPFFAHNHPVEEAGYVHFHNWRLNRTCN